MKTYHDCDLTGIEQISTNEIRMLMTSGSEKVMLRVTCEDGLQVVSDQAKTPFIISCSLEVGDEPNRTREIQDYLSHLNDLGYEDRSQDCVLIILGVLSEWLFILSNNQRKTLIEELQIK